MIPMTSAGLSKSLNQRFFLVTRAPAAPPGGASEASTEESLDSEAGCCSQGGQIQFWRKFVYS